MPSTIRKFGILVLSTALFTVYPASAAKTAKSTAPEQYPATESGGVSIEVSAPVEGPEVATKSFVAPKKAPTSVAPAARSLPARQKPGTVAAREAERNRASRGRVAPKRAAAPNESPEARLARMGRELEALRSELKTGRAPVKKKTAGNVEKAGTVSKSPVAQGTEAAEGAAAGESPRDERGAYEPVPSDRRSEVAQRLVLVDRLIRSYGRAYDYRIHTASQLKRIFLQLEGKAVPEAPRPAAEAPQFEEEAPLPVAEVEMKAEDESESDSEADTVVEETPSEVEEF